MTTNGTFWVIQTADGEFVINITPPLSSKRMAISIRWDDEESAVEWAHEIQPKFPNCRAVEIEWRVKDWVKK